MPGGKPTATEKRLKERQAKLSAAGEERSAAISEEDALEAVSDLEGKVETWHLAAENDLGGGPAVAWVAGGALVFCLL